MVTAPARPELQPERRRPESPRRDRALPLAVAACLALSALSLLITAQPTYDPYAWIVWGREITEGDLTTLYGPSWKPLPVIFTTVFSLVGDAAPELWVWLARAGGLLGAVFAFRLAARFAGPAAGMLAGGGLLLTEHFTRAFARGNSEGIMVAVSLWAVERHLDGRRDHAFALGFAAALMRPEVWPFWGLYGLWLLTREPARRVLVGALFAANALLWVLPEWWGSGQPFRAAERAQTANPGQPKYADFPFGATWEQFAQQFTLVVLAGAGMAVVLAWRSRRRPELALAVFAAALILEVALMAEAGFAGNVRYAAPATGLVCVLAGIGFARIHPAAAAAALAAVALIAWPTLREDYDGVRAEAELYDAIPGLVAIAGGAERVRGCGGIFTGPFQVPVVAWHLHVHTGEVSLSPKVPGTIFAPRGSGLASTQFSKRGETAQWIVLQRCAA
jgi:hypothetical protein